MLIWPLARVSASTLVRRNACATLAHRWHARCFFAPQTNFVVQFRDRMGAQALRVFLFAGLSLAALAQAAAADPLGDSGDFSKAFAMGWESFDTPIEASTRDANGNRVVVNGRLEIEGTLSGGLMDGFGPGSSFGLGAAQAIGNQLNVVTQGNYNTVIVDSTQINNGDISADVEGDD
jgi:holdfast attachment protein HfaA